MKYNIFTVANEGYSPFVRMFVCSIFDKIDIQNLNKIIIADTGLSEKTKNFLSSFPKVSIMKTQLNTKYSRIHDDSWKKNVYSKAELLLKAIKAESSFFPTIMMDADCIIVENFLDLLDRESDVVACLRNQAGRSPGHQATSTHIGSFFVANTEASLPFIEQWIKEIPLITTIGPDGKRIPQESPALSNTCSNLRLDINIADIDERIIANIEVSPPDCAKVYHLKSDWQFLTIEKRINQPRARYYKNRYLS